MRNNMFRVIALFMAGMLTFSLAGCKSSDTSSLSDEYEIIYQYEDGEDGNVNEVGNVTGNNTNADGTNSSGNKTSASAKTSNNSSSGSKKPSGKGAATTVNAGVNPQDYDGTSITFATWSDPGLHEDGPVVKAFEKKYGIKVKVDLMDESNYVNTVLGRIASGNAPDVFFCTYTFPYCLKALQPLDAAKLDLSESIWDKPLINLATINGKSYLVDTVGNIWKDQDMVFYNKKLFKANGWTTPEEYYKAGKWTFAAMKDCMQKVASLGTDYIGGAVNLEGLLGSTGSGIFNYSNGKFSNGSTNSTTKAVMRWASEGMKEGWLRTTSHYQSINYFPEGKTGIAVVHSYGLKNNGFFRKMNVNDIGFTYLPSWKEGSAATPTSFVRGWGICEGAKNPVAAGIFLRYYLDVNNYDTKSAFINSEAESFFFKLTSTQTDKKHFYFCMGSGVEGVTGSSSCVGEYISSVTTGDPGQLDKTIKSYQNKLNSDIAKLNGLLK